MHKKRKQIPTPRYRVSLLLLLMTCVVSGCMHPLSEEARTDINPDISFAMISDNPGAHHGQRILVGGVVLTHQIEKDHSILELLQWHINRWGEPTSLDDSGRRLLVMSSRILDPSRYEPGRLVTLAGVVDGEEVRLRGNAEYKYPVLDLVEIHLWDSPFRYGIHHYDPAHPHYVGSKDDLPDRHPYDPGYSTYPYTPYWYRDSTD